MNDNLLFVSEDLEQSYHRGIAFYSKSLLRATHRLGSDNHFMTGAPATRSQKLDGRKETGNYLTLLKIH